MNVTSRTNILSGRLRTVPVFAVLIALWACGSEVREVQIEMPEEIPVVERFKRALDIINALAAEDFPEPLEGAGNAVHADDITSADLSLSVVADITEGRLVPDSEQVYIVCTIHNRQKAERIADECRRRVSEHVGR